MPALSPARKAAFQVLMAVERGHSHSDDLLRGRAVSALSPPDRNLATTLVLGVLRWQIRLDRQIQAHLVRPNARLDPEVRIALRLGAFQIIHLDRIPARAAIDESVELAKQAGHRFASGMVNAVLRKLSEVSLAFFQDRHVLKGRDSGCAADPQSTSRALPLEECLAKHSPADIAIAQAHPAWMVERWVGFYGVDAARSICLHGQGQPGLTVRLASPAVEAELLASGIQLAPAGLLTAARTVLSGDVATNASFQQGRVRFQDEGSQLVAEIAAGTLPHGQANILDACAAPGGKTLILAERSPQARIVACESSSPRLNHLCKRLAPFAARVECRLADATALDDDGLFDLVLADVPCSGTGTLGRNPEIRHRLCLEDLPRQAERQRALLRAALRAVRPGGRVVYSTCSLEPEENEQVVAAVLAELPSARPVPLQLHLEALHRTGILCPAALERLMAFIAPEGALRLLPGPFGSDGFFIAMIERSG